MTGQPEPADVAETIRVLQQQLATAIDAVKRLDREVTELRAALAEPGPTTTQTTEPTGLREQLAATLRTTPRTGHTDHPPTGAHGLGHRYDARCALCTDDVDALTEALIAVIEQKLAAHNDGPTIAECRDADRRWPLQKTGE